MKDILFIRPGDDSSAIQVAAWGQAVRQMAGSLQTDDLCGAQATRSNVDKKLSADFRHLFWFGHGTTTALIAKGQALVDAQNISNVRGGVVVAIACYAAVTLGRSAKSGSNPVAFLGFDDELGFPANAPLPMMFAVTRGLSCLFQQRHDVKYAADQLRTQFDRARMEYKQNGAKYGMSPSDARTAWLFAKSNRYSVRTHGDIQAVL